MVEMVVVLPAPLPPSSAVHGAGLDRKRDAVDRGHGLVALDQAVDGDGQILVAGASMIPQM